MPIVQPLPGPINIDIPPGSAGADFRYAVYAKQYWDAAWFLVEDLIPISATESDINGESVATFVYDFGRVSQVGQIVPGAHEPIVAIRGNGFVIPLRDVFIAIKVFTFDPPSEYCIWCGYMPSEQIELFGNRLTTNQTANPPITDYPLPQGGQMLKAYGFEYILSRRRVLGAKVWAGNRDTGGVPTEDDTTTTRNPNKQPVFNERGGSGRHFLGNKSIKRMHDTAGPTGEATFGFSEDGLTWSWLEIIEYLLYWSNDYSDVATFHPLPHFFMDGSADPADDPADRDPLYTFLNAQRSDEIQQDGLDVLAIIRRMIDPRRGVGAVLRWDKLGTDNLPAFDAKIMLSFFSMSDKDLNMGTYILPANQNSWEDDIDSGLAIIAASVEVDSSNVYDEIVIQGEPMVVCFSASSPTTLGSESYARLAPAWTVTDEGVYALASPAGRYLDRFEKVYTTFKLVSGDEGLYPFDWYTQDLRSLLPKFDEMAYMVTDAQGNHLHGDYFNVGKEIMRELPLPAPFDLAQEVSDYNFSRCFAIVAVLDDNGLPTGKWESAHQPPTPGESSFFSNGPDISATVSPSDRNLEVKVKFPYNHALARNHFLEVGGFGEQPRYDYDHMIITLAIESDIRPSVTLYPTGNQPLSKHRRIVINVANCETWWIAPNTVTGISNSTHLPLIWQGVGASAELVRDDTERLRNVAMMATKIYGQPVISVNITRHGLYDIYAVGSLLKAKTKATVAYLHRDPNDTSDAKELLSIITQRVFDFREKTVSIATGPLRFGEID